jgi:hypothetical protein
MRQREPRADAKQSWPSLLGRLALIVSLWNAPLPIMHAHGADSDSLRSPGALASHLVDYHPDILMNSHVDLGWHWHLVPPPVNHPGDESKAGPCPFCPQDARDSQLQAQSAVDLFQLASMDLVPAWRSKCPERTVRIAPATPTQFLDTYLGSVPLRTLLRVVRC